MIKQQKLRLKFIGYCFNFFFSIHMSNVIFFQDIYFDFWKQGYKDFLFFFNFP